MQTNLKLNSDLVATEMKEILQGKKIKVEIYIFWNEDFPLKIRLTLMDRGSNIYTLS